MEDWMKHIPDSTKIKALKGIPQSHNTGSVSPLFCHMWPVWPFVQCQNLSITAQLEMGIRAFDLTLTWFEGVCYISHSFLSSYTLSSVLQDIYTFLEQYPSECVFVFMKNSKTCVWSRSDYINIWNLFDNTFIIQNNNNKVFDTTIGSLRRRIIPVISGEFIKYKSSNIGYMNINRLDIIECWNTKSVEHAKQKVEANITKYKFNTYKSIELNVDVKIGNIPLPPCMVSYKLNDWFFSKLKNEWKGRSVGFVGFDFPSPDNVQTLINMNNITTK